MDDKTLLARFDAYIKDRGYTADKAAKIIGVTRNSIFNWRNGKPISARARAAMRVLLVDNCDTDYIDDPFLAIVIQKWKFLTDTEKGNIAGHVSELASKKQNS